MAYVIIGATGGLGRALSSRLSAAGHALILVARDAAALEALAGDLGRSPGGPHAVVAADVTAGPAYLEEVLAAGRRLGGIEGVLFPIGGSMRDNLETDPAAMVRLVHVNFTSIAEAVAELWSALAEAPRPVIVGFGSITAIRGRRRNLVYGAAKRALAHYFEALTLAGAEAGVSVQFYVLGFMAGDTAKAQRPAMPTGDPDRLAKRVAANLGRASGTFWFPRWWAPLALALRLLPGPLYRRLASAPGA